MDEYGFLLSAKDNSTIAQKLSSSETQKRKHLDQKLEAKWKDLLVSEIKKHAPLNDNKKVKKLCRKGIPNSLRGLVWKKLANIDRLHQDGLYQQLQQSEPLPIFEIIQRDIHRCYPEHSLFREQNSDGQQKLRRILYAFAAFQPSIGYCQGMGMVAGMLLMNMEEEDAFWTLVSICTAYMSGYYGPDLFQMKVDAGVLDLLLKAKCSNLYKHISGQDIEGIMYLTQWFMTIYTVSLPWNIVLRIWDVFLCEGPKITFRIALGILKLSQNHILKNCPTTGDILNFLLHIPKDLFTPDALLKVAFRMNLKRSEIEMYRRMKESGQ